ncbi:prolyl 4-hydroxylase [Seminavis robusta]|uniref:Prolyl 4-hydroxylase n=1 Tax=Seminavis robusta TaxID=568900 RepID=A0A9N8EJC5_9STRA|nr:prolyl 4-hydroxylase [Seminavis robusta]|eukprot:Sro1093_g240390.1 prolyl 4-hydroxylase (165) ;mRNA; r:17494-18243
MPRPRISPRRPHFLVGTLALILLLSFCIPCCQARSCVAVPSSTTGVDEHQCTDDPLLLAQAVDPTTGEQTGRYNLGLSQRIDGTESEKQAIRDVLERMEHYFIHEVLSHPEYASARNRCKNLNELCAFWVAVGECESNRIFMLSNCALACRFCLLLNTDLPTSS